MLAVLGESEAIARAAVLPQHDQYDTSEISGLGRVACWYLSYWHAVLVIQICLKLSVFFLLFFLYSTRCHEKTVKKAYCIICEACATSGSVCMKCGEPKDIVRE